MILHPQINISVTFARVFWGKKSMLLWLKVHVWMCVKEWEDIKREGGSERREREDREMEEESESRGERERVKGEEGGRWER